MEAGSDTVVLPVVFGSATLTVPVNAFGPRTVYEHVRVRLGSSGSVMVTVCTPAVRSLMSTGGPTKIGLPVKVAPVMFAAWGSLVVTWAVAS